MHRHGNAVRARQDEFVQCDNHMTRAELFQADVAEILCQRLHQLAGMRQSFRPQGLGDGIVADGL